uniref:hypothetical protein n=1 Tax=Thauera sp. SDU_THAU2 TaxID=3136633 RepID=UPI00311F6D24
MGNNPINFNDPTVLAAKELELFAGKVGGSIDRWWDSSVAGFQSDYKGTSHFRRWPVRPGIEVPRLNC